MHISKVMFLQFLQSDRCLSTKIRTGQFRAVHGFEPGHDAESAMDIALCDHHTGHLQSLREAWPENGPALAPEPETIGRFLPRLPTFIVEGMVAQDLKRGVHEFPENVGSVSVGNASAIG